MTERPSLRPWLVVQAHQVLEHLTIARARLGIVRRRLRTGDFDPQQAQGHLDQVDREIDVAANMAQDLREQVERLANEE